MKQSFQGSIVALPTPFADDRVDFEAMRGLIERQVEGRSSGIVAAGTTGEAATLDERERLSLIELCAGVAGDRLDVIAGIGTNDTRDSVHLAREAERAGADGLLAVTPYYNRPTQTGLARHYGAIAEASDLPLVLYNVPSRTGVDLLPETVAGLVALHGNIVAIKEASGSIERIYALREIEGLDVLCGEDHLIADCMQLGAAGTIGVVGNLFPAEVAELVRTSVPAGTAGNDEPRAALLVEFFGPIIRALFRETNPAPLKAALGAWGLCREELRLPLVPISEGTRRHLERALAVPVASNG